MDKQLNNFEKYIADLKEQDTDIVKINEAYKASLHGSCSVSQWVPPYTL